MPEFTSKIIQEMNSWTEDENENIDPDEVLDFLKDAKKLCTPGFILKREIKRLVVEKILKVEIDAETFNALPINENIEWDEKIIESLAKSLKKKFKDYGISEKQWTDYLNDKAFCNRNNAVKIIFAFNMNDDEAYKFMVACGHNLFSARNPFDYICMFCRKCKLSYFDALKLLNDFENNTPYFFLEQALTKLIAQKNLNPEETIKNIISAFNMDADTAKDFTIAFKNSLSNVDNAEKNTFFNNMTQNLKNETIIIFENDKMNPTEKKQRLISYMSQNRGAFSPKIVPKTKNIESQYSTGFSLHRIKMLQALLKYIALLYPEVELFNQYTLTRQPIQKKDNGEPRVYRHLIEAMLQTHCIDPADLDFNNILDKAKSARDAANIAYSVPFNSGVLLPLKLLSENLRAIMRTLNNPDNANDLDRNTLLLLTYFFIAAYREALFAEKLKEKAKAAELSKDEKHKLDNLILKEIPAELKIDSIKNFINDENNDKNERDLLTTIREIVNRLQELETKDFSQKEKLDMYIDSLNDILDCFDFSSCYLPFILDRFILLCLLANPLELPLEDNDIKENALQYLMKHIIDKNLEQS